MASDVVVLGSVNQDTVLRVAAMPRPGETIASSGLTRGLGGKGGNQAIAAARAGAVVALIGAVGDDAAGREALATLGADLDVTGLAVRAGQATGAATVLVADDGENMIVVAAGANATVGEEEIAAAPLSARVALAQLETPFGTVRRFCARARAAGALVMLNAAPASREVPALLADVDILVVNETELALVAAEAVPEDADAAVRLARSLIAREGQTVIVTLGAAGAVAVTREGTTKVPAAPATVIDTTGAGDCFCGVLAASLAAGLGLAEAMRRGASAAAILVGRPGAADQMPTAAEIDATLDP